ncbi:MAG: GNAT family N-acetyltransferase [Ruminiclostridium sp.]|nr:GNAT family N-acetyltransferase [Ruminiclostridium sp.]
MYIRTATLEDLEPITAVEAACFPPTEAAPRESFQRRLTSFPGHFWLLWDGDTLVSFVNGMVTQEPDLRDEMYEKADLHDETGPWQMIFGVTTLPAYRHRGCAAQLLNRVIDDARTQGRKGLVLTCKEHMLHYYAKFGFVNEGLSQSSHGKAVWHQMRITL